jgi:hypothetical protein
MHANHAGKHGFLAHCSCCSGAISSRRQVLTGLGAIGAATMLPFDQVLGQGAGARLIDTNQHFYPPEYQ